jgi:hypothetical protein
MKKPKKYEYPNHRQRHIQTPPWLRLSEIRLRRALGTKSYSELWVMAWFKAYGDLDPALRHEMLAWCEKKNIDPEELVRKRD